MTLESIIQIYGRATSQVKKVLRVFEKYFKIVVNLFRRHNQGVWERFSLKWYMRTMYSQRANGFTFKMKRNIDSQMSFHE